MKKRVTPHPLLVPRCKKLAHYFHSRDRRIVSKIPYIKHPESVAHMLTELHYGPIPIGAGWLHDCPEDHPDSCPIDELAELIGCPGAEQVVEIVATVTYDPSCQSKHERYERYLTALAKNPKAMPVALADDCDNIGRTETDLRLGIPVFGANYLNCDPREEIENWLAVAALCLEKRHHDRGVIKLCERVITLTRSVKSILIAKKFMKPF
jgi:hypothetical protein